eukprot:100003-Rhodomonas_salina.1
MECSCSCTPPTCTTTAGTSKLPDPSPPSPDEPDDEGVGALGARGGWSGRWALARWASGGP